MDAVPEESLADGTPAFTHSEAEQTFERVSAYVDTVDPQTIGGLWWHDRRRLVVGVSFTTDVERHRDALTRLVGAESVVVSAAEFAEVELQAVADRIGDDMKPGGLVNFVSVNEEAGLVEVGVASLNDDIRAAVHARWPHPAVTVIGMGPFFTAR